MQKDNTQILFFEFKGLGPLRNYGQVYIRTHKIEEWSQLAPDQKVGHTNAGKSTNKILWTEEFKILDPDHNLLAFGQSV